MILEDRDETGSRSTKGKRANDRARFPVMFTLRAGETPKGCPTVRTGPALLDPREPRSALGTKKLSRPVTPNTAGRPKQLGNTLSHALERTRHPVTRVMGDILDVRVHL